MVEKGCQSDGMKQTKKNFLPRSQSAGDPTRERMGELFQELGAGVLGYWDTGIRGYCTVVIHCSNTP